MSDSIGPFLGPLRDAANLALSALKPDDEVALFTFSTEAELRVPFTRDKSAISKQINEFKVGGATNINDGIFIASKYLLNLPPKGRRVIILISDDVGTSAGGQGTNDIITETIAADATLVQLENPGLQSAGNHDGRCHGTRFSEYSQSYRADGRGNFRCAGCCASE